MRTSLEIHMPYTPIMPRWVNDILVDSRVKGDYRTVANVPEPWQHGDSSASDGYPLFSRTRAEWWRDARQCFTGDVQSVRKITDTMPLFDLMCIMEGNPCIWHID